MYVHGQSISTIGRSLLCESLFSLQFRPSKFLFFCLNVWEFSCPILFCPLTIVADMENCTHGVKRIAVVLRDSVLSSRFSIPSNSRSPCVCFPLWRASKVCFSQNHKPTALPSQTHFSSFSFYLYISFTAIEAFCISSIVYFSSLRLALFLSCGEMFYSHQLLARKAPMGQIW